MLDHADMQSMLSEISQMKDLSHPNVMSLLGVCINAAQGLSIIMPYMANGSLLDYLKKERKTLYLDFGAETDTVRNCDNDGFSSAVYYISWETMFGHFYAIALN